MKARLTVAMAGALLLSGAAQAAEIKLIASAGIKEVLLELLPQFEQASGHKVSATWGSSSRLAKRVADGEVCDAVIIAGPEIDELIKMGKLAASSRFDAAKSGVGVAVRAGAPKPDISSAEAVKKAVLAAKSVGYSGGASGTYIASMFQKMGIADQVKSKTATVRPSEPVGEVVARGDAEIGFHQVSELLPVSGIDYLGPLPAEIQQITVFSGGIHNAAKEAEAAKALVKFITAPAAAATIKKKGMEPG